MPGNDFTANVFRETSLPYKSVESIDDYIDYHDDPHVKALGSDFYFYLKENNVDPCDTSSLDTPPIPGIVCLGVGNGEFLNYMVKAYKPYCLIIILTCWEDLISSFEHVDWEALANYYNNSVFRLRIGKIKPTWTDMLGEVANFGILSMEHMFIYTPESTDSNLLELRPALIGREAQNLLLYQGYTVDEYNMILNTARFLAISPKIYNKPTEQIVKRAVVVGSGPSLDSSIDDLKVLSKTHAIICGGSNYRVLLKNGIQPDFLVLVERADNVFDTYKSIYDEFGKTTTKLVTSSTCFSRLSELFVDTCIFYRPALTPLAVFSESDREVISHEGPQAVCAAFSFAVDLQPDSVIMVGVDLGSSDENSKRASDAIGYSPRSWDDKVTGNLSDFAFTDRRLLDCRDMIATRIKSIETDLKDHIYNSSDGIFIDGTKPVTLSNYLKEENDDLSSANSLDSWWSGLSKADIQRTKSILQLRQPRNTTLKLIRDLKDVLQDNTIPWFPTVVLKVDHLLNLNGKSRKEQIPIRIIKSTVMKAIVSTSQIFFFMNKSQSLLEKRVSFGSFAKQRIIELLDQLERETYLLFDYIDDMLEVNQ